MKLILAILHDAVSQNALPRLVERGFRVTLLASNSGVWKKGNTTFLVGVPEAQVEEVFRLIGDCVEVTEAGELPKALVFLLKNSSFFQF